MNMILFTGIQATGKSEFYKRMFFNTHVRINLDMLKTRNRERILMDACLAAKQPFVVDNTNPTRRDRALYIEAAKAAGFSITGYHFVSDVQDALERNARREGKARVPDVAVYATAKKFETPEMDEGFDALYRVRIEDQGFVIE